MQAGATGPLRGRLGWIRGGSRLAGLAAALGLLALVLHGANLLHRARLDGCASPALLCDTPGGPWGARTGDFPSYAAVARDIEDRGVWRASYWSRTPGYPLLLVLTRAATGHESPVHWAGPLLAAGATVAVTVTAGQLLPGPASLPAAALAGGLLLLWPSAYQFSADLRPDGPHAFLAAIGLAATLSFRRRGGAGRAGLAAAAWVGAQSLRPTLFALPALLPLLLLRRGRSRREAALALALWASTLPLPAFVVASNALQHGAAVPTKVMSQALACYAVPRLMNEIGRSGFSKERRRCAERFAALPDAERPGAQVTHALAVFRAFPRASLRSFAGELRTQLLHPPRLARYARYVPGSLRAPPLWPPRGRTAMALFWVAAAAGSALVARRDPWLGAFLAGLFALVVLPTAASHQVGERLRLPADLLFLPLAARALAAALRKATDARVGRRAARRSRAKID